AALASGHESFGLSWLMIQYHKLPDDNGRLQNPILWWGLGMNAVTDRRDSPVCSIDVQLIANGV
ncbi:hypothetical protein, partial [Methylobacterium sp. WL116]|uniref:hypothetical protein n=1 Tax=Methylobacterium sp. WL116 TaxID=2603889 RepID=UPI001AEDA516